MRIYLGSTHELVMRQNRVAASCGYTGTDLGSINANTGNGNASISLSV